MIEYTPLLQSTSKTTTKPAICIAVPSTELIEALALGIMKYGELVGFREKCQIQGTSPCYDTKSENRQLEKYEVNIAYLKISWHN